MGRKKPFIAKGEGVKFNVVHRSQKDPLYLDQQLGEHVLVPVDAGTNEELVEKINKLTVKDPNNEPNPFGIRKTKSEKEAELEKRRKEQNRFGIYFEDKYDYMQHLKQVESDNEDDEDKHETIQIGCVKIKEDLYNENEKKESFTAAPTSKLQLPSTVFASKVEDEEKVGYFNQAAPDHDPKIGWDPEIVQFLDEDADIDFENPDNVLDDDFFATAQNPSKNKENNEESEDNEDDDNDYDSNKGERSDDDDEFRSDYDSDGDEDGFGRGDFEAKERFSTYSMSSQVVPRNHNLRQLDSRFENMFAEYDDEQIGALDTEEIDGYLETNNLVMTAALDHFDKTTKVNMYETEKQEKKEPLLDSVLEEEESQDEEEEGGEETDSDLDSDDTDKFDEDGSLINKNYELKRYSTKKDKDDRMDCESIVSTYSNIYNRPAMISSKPIIELSAKTGLPLNVLPEKRVPPKKIELIEHKITRILPDIAKRERGETLEEKKARKQAVKEHKKERRVEKKINKQQFKQEEKVQKAQAKGMKENAHTVLLPL